jgi:membrane protein implicated in regulation of membrane protease activity
MEEGAKTMVEFFESYAIWIIWITFGLFFLVVFVMAPCHAVFFVPFAGLPLFWLLPLGYALPINIAAWLATPFLYRVIRRAMRKPPADGFRSLVGTQAEVVSKSETGRSAKYLVRVQGEGELWSACSTDVLDIGEWVNVAAVKGIGLAVERAVPGSRPGKTGNAKTMASGAKDNRRHCH